MGWGLRTGSRGTRRERCLRQIQMLECGPRHRGGWLAGGRTGRRERTPPRTPGRACARVPETFSSRFPNAARFALCEQILRQCRACTLIDRKKGRESRPRDAPTGAAARRRAPGSPPAALQAPDGPQPKGTVPAGMSWNRLTFRSVGTDSTGHSNSPPRSSAWFLRWCMHQGVAAHQGPLATMPDNSARCTATVKPNGHSCTITPVPSQSVRCRRIGAVVPSFLAGRLSCAALSPGRIVLR